MMGGTVVIACRSEDKAMEVHEQAHEIFVFIILSSTRALWSVQTPEFCCCNIQSINVDDI